MSTRRKGTGVVVHRQRSHSIGMAMLQARSRALLDSSQQRDISIAYRAAFSAMCNGRGTEQFWHTLAAALCISDILLDAGICSDSRQIVVDAQAALIVAGKSSRASGRWMLGTRSFIINAGLGILDEQMKQATTAQVSAALREIMAGVS